MPRGRLYVSGTASRYSRGVRRGRAARSRRVWKSRSRRRALSTTKKIRRTILRMAEPKSVYQTVFNLVEMANDTAPVKIVMPVTGDLEDQRDGDKIYLDWLKLRVFIEKTADNGTEMLRVLGIRWKMDNAHDTPVIDDVLESTLFGTANIVQAPYTLDKSRRAKFEVLYDKVVMSDHPPGGSLPKKHLLAATIPLKRMHKFEDAGADGQNNMYFWILSNYTAAARVNPLALVQTVLQFRDV